MLKTKLTAIVLVLMMLMSNTAIAADVPDIELVATEDTYIANNSRWQNTNYGTASTMLFGSSYNRYALIKFDLSDINLEAYHGALLEFYAAAEDADTNIYVYSTTSDWSEKSVTWANFSKQMTFQAQLPISKTGFQKYEISLNKALESAKDAGENFVSLILASDAVCINAYSSENSTVSRRPRLVLTENEAFVHGQVDAEYSRPSVELVANDIKNNISSQNHPYIIARQEDFDEIKEYGFGKDETMTRLYSNVKETADSFMPLDLLDFSATYDGERILSKAYDAVERISYLAMVYRVEGDETYAQRAWEELEQMTTLPNWSKTMLDNSTMAVAAGIGYDWLYDWLTQEKRDAIVAATKKLSLDIATDIYFQPDLYKTSRNPTGSSQYGAIFNDMNHSSHNNSNFIIGALAIGDVDPEYSAYIVSNALFAMEDIMNVLAPDGGCYEGTGYWGYIGEMIGRMLSAMNSSLGTMYGYNEIPGIAKTGYYPIYMQSSVGNMIYNDMYNYVKTDTEVIYYLGKMNGDKALQKLCLEWGFKGALIPLWYDAHENFADTSVVLTKDKLFRNVDAASMRDTWSGTQEIFAGFRTQQANSSHNDAGSGGFHLDALGERWVTGLGKENYDLKGYWDQEKESGQRWTYYARRAEANNCVVINPDQGPGQIVAARPEIDVFESKDRGAYAISDLTVSYADNAKSYKRGVSLFNDRKSFKIQDEMTLIDKSEVYWFMNINAKDVTVSEDKKSILIKKNGKMLHVGLSTNADYEVDFTSSVPLPTSPNPSGQTIFKDTKKIALHFTDVKDLNITAVLTPILSMSEIPAEAPEFIPMDKWEIPDGELDRIMLDSLMVSGEEIIGFDPYNRYYEYSAELPAEELDITGISDKYDCKTVITEDGCADIIVSEKDNASNFTVYHINLKAQGMTSIDLSKYSEVRAKSVSATANDGNLPEYTLDGYLSSRWSASGEQSITFDLGSVQDVGVMGMAFYNGATRVCYYELYASEDGKNWTYLFEGESTGKTEDFEYVKLDTKARYIKYTGFGNNTGPWNSIAEVRFYK